jgi:hypothetical protein
MGVVIKWSVILVIAVAALTVVINLTGLHTNPLAGGIIAIGVAIILNVWTLFMALRATATGNTYGAQLLNALMFGLLAGVLIFACSWILSTYVFPDTVHEMQAGFKEWVQNANLSEAQVQSQIAAIDQVTATSQAMNGAIGTLFTSLIAGAIIAIFKRRK